MSLLSCGGSYALVFERLPQISLSRTRKDRMIHTNIPKSPTQQSYLSAPATWEMSESQGETERWRERESPSRQIKKKSKEWTALNGFSTPYYKDISPHFHSDPTCIDTLLSRHTTLPTLLSLPSFITLPQSIQLKALQMFFPPYSWPKHTVRFQKTLL